MPTPMDLEPNERIRLEQLALTSMPWLTLPLIDVWVEAYIQYGTDPGLILNEVRNGAGRQVYDQVFKGNRREDGTLRLSEGQYFAEVQGYRNSLAARGLNPAIFEDRFGDLIAGEKYAAEFEQNIAAVQEGILMQGGDIRRAFAEASGGLEFTDEALLATVLDPEGVGRELLDRRISMAQVRGAAAEAGFTRTQAQADALARYGVSLQQARGFYQRASGTLATLGSTSRTLEGQAGPTIDTLEDATVLGEQQSASRIERLLARERASFTSNQSTIRRSQDGALTGLDAPQ